MLNKDLGCYISVISHKRPSAVGPMSALIGKATWIVGKGEAGEYHNHGAEWVAEGGGLCASRNFALKNAFSVGVPCIQLSDDLKKIQFAYHLGDDKKSRPLEFFEAVQVMRNRLDKSPYCLAGVAPTANLFYFNKATSTNLFIVGDFILVKPCDLFFDEQLKLKEDYDYTIQHILKYGGALRNNDVLTSFLHRTNPGGAVSVRTSQMEKNMIQLLKAKWPGWIKDNPRRKDEILMRAPKAI